MDIVVHPSSLPYRTHHFGISCVAFLEYGRSPGRLWRGRGGLRRSNPDEMVVVVGPAGKCRWTPCLCSHFCFEHSHRQKVKEITLGCSRVSHNSGGRIRALVYNAADVCYQELLLLLSDR